MRVKGKRGFTLVEVVLTLVLVSLVASMLVPFMGRALHQSAEMPLQVQHSAELSGLMASVQTNQPASSAQLIALRDFLNGQPGFSADLVYPDGQAFVVGAGATNLLRVTVTNSRRQRISTLIGLAAAADCSNPVQVTVDELVFLGTDWRAAWITGYTANHTAMALPNSNGTWAITTIQGSVFAGRGIQCVTLPHKLRTIFENTFRSNNLERIVLPNTMQVVGNSSFRNNRLTSVDFGTGIRDINRYSFANNLLSDITIPPSALNISEGAFAGNQAVPANLIIRGVAGSRAESYAAENGHTFVPLP